MKSAGLLIAALVSAGLLGCAKDTDDHRQPLPRDTRNLLIPVLRASARFVAPRGWHIVQQPDANNAVFVLARTSKHEQPVLSVYCALASVDPDTPQDTLQAERLEAIRKDFPDAGFRQAGTAVTATGREGWIYHYVGDDGEQLVAIIPEEGFTTTIRLNAQNAEDIAACRRAFVFLLGSYRS